jgi:hypothetical protein
MWRTGPQHRAPAVVFAALLAVISAGCAAKSDAGMGREDPNRITPDEVAIARSQGVGNLEELIQRLRPRWLQTDRVRSFGVETAILVYDDGTPLGGVDVLSTMPVDQVRELRWLNAAQAGTLPGAGGLHVEGAIVIIRD